MFKIKSMACEHCSPEDINKAWFIEHILYLFAFIGNMILFSCVIYSLSGIFNNGFVLNWQYLIASSFFLSLIFTSYDN